MTTDWAALGPAIWERLPEPRHRGVLRPTPGTRPASQTARGKTRGR